MAASFQQYRDEYEQNWNNLRARDERSGDIRREARRLFEGKQTYQEVERRSGVPWWFVGLCHYRESSFDFDTYLGNGQPLNRRTTIVPKGRGPFTGPTAFVDGAVDALRIQKFVGAQDWGIARVLYRLEGFNGYGYHSRGVNSPYLYGGSTVYGPPENRGGKFVRDHVFDAHTVDRQLGTAVILKELVSLDPTIRLDGVAPGDEVEEPEDEQSHTILWLQRSLNRLGADPQLEEDGVSGPKTMGAVSRFQEAHGLPDTGLADAATIAAIERSLAPSPEPTLDPLLHRLEQLEKRILAISPPRFEQDRPLVFTPSHPSPIPGPIDGSADGLAPLLEQIIAFLKDLDPEVKTSDGTQPGQADRLRRALQVVVAIFSTAGGKAPLGQVNAALGNTVGELLNGKKTAIGILGAVTTSLLSNVPSGTGLGSVLASITPLTGFGGYMLPVFLAMAGWGVLGKFEKWAQGTAPPPILPK
jgi:lysozyme family protein/peptidoglycan hydrolase-like protein with peptidoglycan-binding domain